MHLSIFCFYPFTAANVGKQRSTERKEFFLYKPSCENKKKKKAACTVLKETAKLQYDRKQNKKEGRASKKIDKYVFSFI